VLHCEVTVQESVLKRWFAKVGFSPPWLTNDVIGWAMFDFANQAFTMVMVTVMFQDYFINYVVPRAADGESNAPGKRWWEISNITAEVVLIAVSPLLGALADFSGAKKTFLFSTYVGCVLACLLLGLVMPGDVGMAAVLFVAGYVCFGAGENFLNAFLPEIADHRHMGRVSAFSWTIAYIGSLISLLVAVLLVQVIPEPASYRWVSVWCGVYFLAAGIPAFVYLRERKKAEPMPAGKSMATVGFSRLRSTFQHLRAYRQLFRFLIIVMIYMAGMQVVVFYAGTITEELFHFSDARKGLFLLEIILAGVAGTILTGLFQDRLGTKWTIMLWLVTWSITMLAAGAIIREVNGVNQTPEWQFWVVGNFVGLSMGALGASSRAMAGLFSPEHKAAEFFGFYGMAQKMAVILGLGMQFVLGFVFHASFKTSIGASAVFFVAGFLLMLTIDEKEGRTAALRAVRAYRREMSPRQARREAYATVTSAGQGAIGTFVPAITGVAGVNALPHDAPEEATSAPTQPAIASTESSGAQADVMPLPAANEAVKPTEESPDVPLDQSQAAPPVVPAKPPRANLES